MGDRRLSCPMFMVLSWLGVSISLPRGSLGASWSGSQNMLYHSLPRSPPTSPPPKRESCLERIVGHDLEPLLVRSLVSSIGGLPRRRLGFAMVGMQLGPEVWIRRAPCAFSMQIFSCHDVMLHCRPLRGWFRGRSALA
ncbi:hypothetical protein BHE74_00005850 [Ensete ventricosum]|nr:hypothetical protein GW17_00021164 [Ensete ventricosum]RWW85464.1 hypothetical protein BHE74_00005850 [Ensete ventricosum]RZR90851.1 hypothetical protein BHM03_00018828 [Ensete ventricosum]